MTPARITSRKGTAIQDLTKLIHSTVLVKSVAKPLKDLTNDTNNHQAMLMMPRATLVRQDQATQEQEVEVVVPISERRRNQFQEKVLHKRALVHML